MVDVIPAPETPLDPDPEHLPTCGTAHRGCDPQCPKRWFEEGEQRGYDAAVARVRRLFELERTP